MLFAEACSWCPGLVYSQYLTIWGVPPLIGFELVSSAQFPMWSRVLDLLQVRSGRWFGLNGWGGNQNGIRTTRGNPVSERQTSIKKPAGKCPIVSMLRNLKVGKSDKVPLVLTSRWSAQSNGELDCWYSWSPSQEKWSDLDVHYYVMRQLCHSYHRWPLFSSQDISFPSPSFWFPFEVYPILNCTFVRCCTAEQIIKGCAQAI